MFQLSDVSLPRMNYNFSPPRPSNYGGPQNVTTSEANFISVDEGAEKVMQSYSQSEAQEESIQVSQPVDGKVCHMLISKFKIIPSKLLILMNKNLFA